MNADDLYQKQAQFRRVSRFLADRAIYLHDSTLRELIATVVAAQPVRPYCDCPPRECRGKGINECRWQIMGYVPPATLSPELTKITAAWVPFSVRHEIAEKADTVVDERFNEIVRSVVEYVVTKRQIEPEAVQPRPALVTALRGLLASLSRAPTEFELRAAAHEFTVMADRAAAAARRGDE